MINPVRYIRENCSQVKISAKNWLALYQDRKGLRSASKIRKIEDKMALARRDFICASAKLVVTGLAAGGVSAGGALLLHRVLDPWRSIRALTKENKADFPFSQDYLPGLMNDAGISKDEAMRIYSLQGGVGGLYALVGYGVLKRALIMGELSDRYKPYLEEIPARIAKGEIKFNIERDQSASDFIYDSREKIIYADPEGLSRHSEVVKEALVVHELFHAYQHMNHLPTTLSEFEVEAYLAESDFISRKEPGLLRPDRWVRVLRTTGGISILFFFPLNTVVAVRGAHEGDAVLAEVIRNARPIYLDEYVMIGCVDPESNNTYGTFKQWVMQYGKTAGYAMVERDLNARLAKIRERPLTEQVTYFDAPENPEEKGGLGGIKRGDQLYPYGITINYLVRLAYDNGDFNYADDLANRYFIGFWTDPKNSLVNSPLDVRPMWEIRNHAPAAKH